VIDAADACLAAIAAARSKHLNTLLDDLDRLPPGPDPDVLRIKVREPLRAASEAGSIGPHRQAEVEACTERVRHTANRQTVASAATTATALGPPLGFAPRLALSVAGGQLRTCSPKPVRPAGSSPSFRCSEGIS
jgi:hypothetical protein